MRYLITLRQKSQIRHEKAALKGAAFDLGLWGESHTLEELEGVGAAFAVKVTIGDGEMTDGNNFQHEEHFDGVVDINHLS